MRATSGRVHAGSGAVGEVVALRLGNSLHEVEQQTLGAVLRMGKFNVDQFLHTARKRNGLSSAR